MPDDNFFDNFYVNHMKDKIDRISELVSYIREQPIWLFALIGLFVLIPAAFWVYMMNPYKITHIIPRLLLFFFVFLICYSILILSISVDKPDVKLFTFTYKSLIHIGYAVVFFIIFSVLYYISSTILLYSEPKSFFIAILTLFFVLCIVYKQSIQDEDPLDQEESEVFSLLKQFLFYIPCLVVDFTDAVQKDVKGMPQSTYIFIAILVVIALFYYVIPLIQQWKLKSGNYVQLVDEAVELNGEVLYMNQSTLKEKQIQTKPFFQRKLLEQTQLWEKQLNAATEPSILDKYNRYENIEILDGNTLEYTMIKDLADCVGKRIECEEINEFDASSGHLVCVDNSDATKQWKVRNAHNMYQRCLMHEKGSAFSSLFQQTESLKMRTAPTTQPITFEEYCDASENVLCLNVVDASNSNNLDYTLSDNQMNDVSYAYVCNDAASNEDGTMTKYKLIQGYNDICSNEVLFKCSNKEGFEASMYNPDIHKLDDTIDTVDIIDLLSPEEKEIIDTAMQEDVGNFSQRLSNLTEKADIQQLYMEYLSNHDGYSTIISNIHELNRTTNDYIDQETSHLIQMINRQNQIYDYNYHYGLSFWVYFDPELLKVHSNSPEGTIMNYAHNPYMYYHFGEKALIMEIKDCSTTETMNCTPKIIYKSKDVLFQRWNHIVVNYDYGTLDLFVNNNLVSTNRNVSPYIQKEENTIQFGSFENPLTHAGICNVRYYERPLNLTQIKKMYRNKQNPCK